MSNIHPFMLLAFVVLVAIALTQVPNSARDVQPVEAATAQGGEAATPNHDPHKVRLVRPPAAETVATPNHDPHKVALVQPSTAEAVATPNHDPHKVSVMRPSTAEPVATPNHDPAHLRPIPSLALQPETLRAEPEPAAPAAAAVVSSASPAASVSSAAPAAFVSAAPFVGTDTVLYARDGARLRAAPNTKADVLNKLAADVPLRAIARSTDRAWWRVSLGGGRIGYVHRVAVSEYRLVATTKPTPTVAAAPAQPAPTRRSQGLLGQVEETMDWLADRAGSGPAPKAMRPER